MSALRRALRTLYVGDTVVAHRFRYALLVLDVTVVASFLFDSYHPGARGLDLVFVVLLLADLGARLLVTPSPRRFLLDPVTWADVVVIVTLAVPVLSQDLAFLRVLRAMRLFRSSRFQRTLRSDSPFFRRNEEVIESVINLLLFIFVVSAVVLVLQKPQNPQIVDYVDALYFTVTTLTTTGFGDVVLEGSGGRLLAVVIMVLGFALFLRLVQTIIRPPKVVHRCETCGLTRHDPDAVHCKACGQVLHIETEGA